MNKKNRYFDCLFNKRWLYACTAIMILCWLGFFAIGMKIAFSGKELPSEYNDFYTLIAAIMLLNLFFPIWIFLSFIHYLGRSFFEKNKDRTNEIGFHGDL